MVGSWPLGTRHGVVLWDMAGGAELGFLPIGYTPHLTFEASGDLLTSGSTGVRRWPVRLDLDSGEFRLGPPRILPLPASNGEVAEDRFGRVVALAVGDCAYVCTADRVFQLRSLDDVRSVAVSPDGEYLATGSHGKNGAQVWRIRDAAPIAHLEIEGTVRVEFSPDGKWLLTRNPPCRLWEVGTWRGAADRRRMPLFFPGWPDAPRPGSGQDPAPGRDRYGPHRCEADEPRPG